MQETPNLKLQKFDETDGKVKFLDYRLAQSANLDKIDEAVSQSSSNIEALGTALEEVKSKQTADKLELSNTIETVRVGLANEDELIKASITQLESKVNSNHSEMIANDTAIRGEISALDVKIQGDIATAKSEVNATITALENKHNADIKLIQTTHSQDIQAIEDKVFENDVLTKEALLNKADKNHTHTKADVGLGKVENYGIATSEEAIAGVATDKYMTPALVAEALKWGGATTFTNMSVELKEVIVSLYTVEENQKTLTIPYEHFNIENHLLEVRIGGVPFFHDRYTIDGKTVTLKADEIGIPVGKRVDFVITYLEQVGDNKLPIHGRNLYNGSVTMEKLSPDIQEKLGAVVEGGGSSSSGTGMTEEEKQAIYSAIEAKADKDHMHSAYEIAINKKAEKTHTHEDLEMAINAKANIDHVHEKYENIADGKADVNHTHPELQAEIDGKASVEHTHTDLEQAIAGKADSVHTHVDLESKIAEKADLVHTHTEYASTAHASSHGVGGSDEIQVVEEMLSEDLKRKINYPSGDVGFPEIDGVIADVAQLKSDITKKADTAHTHSDLSEQIAINRDSIGSINETLATKADKTELSQSVEELTASIGTKADVGHTHETLATKEEVTQKIQGVESQISSLSSSKAEASHNHDTVYSKLGHGHTASEISGLPTSLPANGGNSATVGGVGVAGLARYYQTNGSVNIADTNLKQFYGTCVTQNSSAPSTDWWHIINVPHADNNGYGGQLAIGYHGSAGLQVRSASGTSWGGWYDVIGNIESLKSSVSSGKSAIATAITGKGVSSTSSDSFATMATKIGQIKTSSRASMIIGQYYKSSGSSSGNITLSGINSSDTYFTRLSDTTFTVPVSGDYLISCTQIMMSGNSSSTYFVWGVKNSSGSLMGSAYTDGFSSLDTGFCIPARSLVAGQTYYMYFNYSGITSSIILNNICISQF